MVLNFENHTIKGYEFQLVDRFRLQDIMYDFAISTTPQHRINLGEEKRETNPIYITGKEFNIITNLRTQDTGKIEWTGGFYNERSYRVHINEYDEYKCPEIYELLGILLNSDNYHKETVLEVLSKISRMCELKKMPLKKVFESYKEELLSLILLKRVENEYIKKLNRLYEILYVENEQLSVFPEKEFRQKYKVYNYNLKNIKKV